MTRRDSSVWKLLNCAKDCVHVPVQAHRRIARSYEQQAESPRVMISSFRHSERSRGSRRTAEVCHGGSFHFAAIRLKMTMPSHALHSACSLYLELIATVWLIPETVLDEGANIRLKSPADGSVVTNPARPARLCDRVKQFPERTGLCHPVNGEITYNVRFGGPSVLGSGF